MKAEAPGRLKLLAAGERDGKPRYHFWQPGRGYDRSLFTPEAIHASIQYIHANPPRAQLCESPLDWPWSSARWYAGMQDCGFQVDPCEVAVIGPLHSRRNR